MQKGGSDVRTLAACLLASALVAGCKHQKPNFVYAPQMHESPAVKAQELGGGTGMPPKGTVPTGEYEAYTFEDADSAGAGLKNTLKPTMVALKRGKEIYNTYCIVCHGPTGLGNGFVVPPYPRPPSLQSDKVMKWPDGAIYHVVTKGQNLMPSYSYKIKPNDRWALIHYIRVIQRADNPSAEDLKAFEKEK
jgi:mono/diheme cytochrome c family protein